MSETAEKDPPQGVTYWRKRSIVIPGVPWEGGNGEQVLAFTSNADGRPRACIQSGSLSVWNDQEKTWLPVPVGHTVMRGALGELYPVSPEAVRETFDPAGEEDSGEPAPETAMLQQACQTLGKVVEWQAETLYAAWIEISRDDLKSAAQWILNGIPDVDDNPPEDQWNGTETAQEWFDRTREAAL